MKRILDGVARFQREVYPQHRALFQRLATSQQPEVLVITCSDSRVVPSLLMQSKPGDAFVCRNAGNMIPTHGDGNSGGVTATIEYAVSVLGVRDILVCGHSNCGAMAALLKPELPREIPAVAQWLRNGYGALAVVRENFKDLPPEKVQERLTEENVISQISHLKTHPCVASRLRAGSLAIHGWVYDIESGQIRVYDSSKETFSPLQFALAAG